MALLMLHQKVSEKQFFTCS